jgi:hypothetical protein
MLAWNEEVPSLSLTLGKAGHAVAIVRSRRASPRVPSARAPRSLFDFAWCGLGPRRGGLASWEAKLAPGLAESLRRRRRGKVGRSWYVDETSITVHGQWRYLNSVARAR